MIDYKNLSTKYQTPLYAYDFDYITARYTALKEAFSARKSLLCYAVKANSNLSVLKHFASLGSGADCVSIGEIKRALLAGIPKYKIIFSCVGKSDYEIKEALKEDILFINIESVAEFNKVEQIAQELNIEAKISIRVNPNIDPQTHPYISTGLSENKFGVSIETARGLYLKAKNSQNIDPVGIHFHIGSQLTNLQPIGEASDIVANLVRSLQKLDINIKFFDIGGGLGVQYSDEETIKPYDYAQVILASLKGLDVTIISENGRFLVANSGYFITKVLYEKENEGKRFVVVDGAMNDLMRPSLYDAYHQVEHIPLNPKPLTLNPTVSDIVGPVCESGDFLAKHIKLPQTNHDDLIVVKSAGAYGFTMSSNYNTRPRAAEVAIENGEDKLIRKRESFEDLIKLEKECL
jgi:diaminopimelate decarboxylase